MKTIINQIRNELPKLTADIWICSGQPGTKEERQRMDSAQKISILLDELEYKLPKS